MNTGNWSRVKELLDACLDLEPAQWPEYLNGACAADSEIRAEVESLLAAHEKVGEEEAEAWMVKHFSLVVTYCSTCLPARRAAIMCSGRPAPGFFLQLIPLLVDASHEDVGHRNEADARVGNHGFGSGLGANVRRNRSCRSG